MTDISSYRWVGANFKPHLKMNDNQQTQLTISNLDQQTRKELRQHFRQQPPQPKRRNDLVTAHCNKGVLLKPEFDGKKLSGEEYRIR